MQDQESVIHTVVRLAERTVILAFGVTVTIAMMYVAGNYQGFSDTTQLQLLWVLQVLSSALTIAAIVLVGLEIVQAVVGRSWRRAGRGVAYTLVAAFSLSLAIGSGSLLVLFQPL